MKVLVVYESLYGNTAAIGEAIAASLRSHGLEVEAGPISKIPPAQAARFDLLVVGGPTHAHGMSTSSTRKTAVDDKENSFPEPTVQPGLREWLTGLPAGAGRLAAAFDTRIDKPIFLTGSAAKGIAQRLAGSGYHLVVKPECFLVTMKNRLREGQMEHAESWGAALTERAAAGTAAR